MRDVSIQKLSIFNSLVFEYKMIRKIFPRKPRPVAEETEIEDPDEWTTFRHSGPHFDSLEEVTEEEMRVFYGRVPKSHRDARFWSNCPFPPSEILKVSREEPEPTTPGAREKHGAVYIDGRRETVSSWRIEQPGVFIGRGDHALRGVFRRRIMPEDITLNLDEQAPIPRLPRGRRWGGVVHQQGAYWLWAWVDPVLDKMKYTYPDPNSFIHAVREREKFDVARQLKSRVMDIRREYMKTIQSPHEDIGKVEFAMILLLIDRLGLRIGNTGSQTGASTLEKNHVSVYPEKRRIRVRFTGKDSIPYDQTMHAEGAVIRAMQRLLQTEGEGVFPHITSRDVNSYLQSINPSLKAKVFRTYNASEIFQRTLHEKSQALTGTSALVGVFKEASLTVARFCNHRRVGTLNKLSEKYVSTTSITNYIDPRITVAWVRKFGVPIQQLYSKTLLKRFDWALGTEEDFVW